MERYLRYHLFLGAGVAAGAFSAYLFFAEKDLELSAVLLALAFLLIFFTNALDKKAQRKRR